MQALSDEQSELLTLITTQYLTDEAFLPINGRALRGVMSGTYEEKQKLIGTLAGPWIVQHGQSPDGDAYSPTRIGTLESELGADVRAVLGATLAALQAKIKTEPAFLTFCYSDLQPFLRTATASTRTTETFVNRVLVLFELAYVTGAVDGSTGWSRPRATELIAELSGVDAFVASLTGAPRPVAPLRQEREQPHGRKRYALEQRPIGIGGYAEVFAAKDKATNLRVAFKRPLAGVEHAKARLVREIDAMRKIDHPNVMPLLDADAHDGWYVMPLAEHNLEQAIGGLGERDVVACVAQVGEGLRTAHLANYVHRDVSPRNVLLVRDGRDARWVIADWGMVRGGRGRTTRRLTRTGAGTEGFAAPETWTDAHTVDQRADVYSLGRILAWGLTHEWPTPNVDLVAPGKWRKVVARMTARRPDDRHPDMSSVLRDLADLGEKNRPTTAGRPATLAGIALLLAVLVPAGVLLANRYRARNPEATLRSAGLYVASASLSAAAVDFDDPPPSLDAPGGNPHITFVTRKQAAPDVSLRYPHLQLENAEASARLNEAIDASITLRLSHFMTALPKSPSYRKGNITIDCDVSYVSVAIVSVGCTNRWYLPTAAHWAWETATFNFEIEKERVFRIALPDLIKNDGGASMAGLRAYCSDALRRQGAPSPEGTDFGRDGGGTAVLEEAMRNAFAISRDGLVFTFDPYVAGPYVAGTFKVLVPFRAMGPWLAFDSSVVRTMLDAAKHAW